MTYSINIVQFIQKTIRKLRGLAQSNSQIFVQNITYLQEISRTSF